MQYDAIVIGGSYAGLSAAMQLARARRSVCVVDGGRPRNRFAAASHGFFGQDGVAPAVMLGQARDKLAAYPRVRFVTGEALAAERVGEGFQVKLAEGRELEARRLVLAYGVQDELPALPGLAERWGRSVLHCPYCHGYEVSDRKLGVLATMSMSSHQAQLVSDWGPTTFFLHEQDAPDEATATALARRGVEVVSGRVVAVEGDAPALTALRLEDGRHIALDALFVAPRLTFTSALHEQLGCELEDALLGPVIRADAMRVTTVPGVFAAGDVARAFSNASIASADGVMAGVSAHQSLVFAP